MKKAYLPFFFLCLIAHRLFAQNCPQNIGFETGTFSNWKLYTGSVSANTAQQKNIIQLSESGVMSNRHTLMTSKTDKDYYGGFPVLAPNGSSFSVKLGNDGTQKNAEGMTYKFRVPTNKPEFTLSYQYAVVFEDPGHPAHQQPRFNAKVLDVTTNQYIQCASFEYIASSNLPGFLKSTVKSPSTSPATIWYKNWTTVTLNLSGYQGKEVLLEFTTADCTQGAHFGYAYVDVNEECEGIIRGNETCSNATSVTLSGPSGYKDYVWYSADRSIRYGNGEQFTFTPALSDGAKVLLDLIPYDGFGCPNTVSTIIKKNTFELKVAPNINLCNGASTDLLSPNVILNKSTDVKYTVYEDSNLTKLVASPSNVTKSGSYYIKAVSNINGCSAVQSISVLFNDYFSALQILPSIKICKADFADLTSPSLFTGLPSGVQLTYFYDKDLKQPVADVQKVGSGTYFIKISKNDCSVVKEITVAYFPEVSLKITSPNPFCLNATADITNPLYYAGSSTNLSYTYYKDLNLTATVENPKMIKTAGRYYIRATNSNGCSATGFIDIVFENPVLKVENPAPVCYPETVDITDKKLYVGSTAGVTFKYFNADNTTLANPSSVKTSGKYYVEITNAYGCSDRKEVSGTINALPIINIVQPKKVLEPKTVNLTDPSLISGSSGYQKVEYFKDAQLTTKLANPDKVAKSGQYYVVLYSAFGCHVKGLFDVVVGKQPNVAVPTAFTPLAAHNNKIYPFVTSIKKMVSFTIYNKWGNLVFKTTSSNPQDGWNGYFNGKLQPYETYSWFVEAIDEIDEKYQSKGQFVMIL